MSGYHTVEGELYTDSGVRVGYQKLDGSELVTSGLDFFVADKPKLAAAIARQKATNGEQPARIMFTGDSTTTGIGAGTNPNDGVVDTTNGRKNSWPVVLAAQKGWQDCSFFGDQNNTLTLGAQTLNGIDPRIAISGSSWQPCPNNKFGYPVTFIATCSGHNLTVTSVTGNNVQNGDQFGIRLLPNMEIFNGATSLGILSFTGTGTGGAGTYTISGTATLSTATTLTGNNGLSFAGRPVYAPANASGSLSFTPTQNITRFKLWYYQAFLDDNDSNIAASTNQVSPTALVVKVDGTTAASVNLNTETVATGGAAYDNSYGGWVTKSGSWVMSSRTFTIATAGIHTINLSLGNGSGSGNTNDLLLYGIEAWDHTNPNPSFFVTGWSGVRAFQLIDRVSANWACGNVFASLATDFTLLNCTINDGSFNTAFANYQAYINQLVELFVRTGDIALVVGNVGGSFYNSSMGIYGDTGNFVKTILPYYRPFLMALAARYGGSFANCQHIFGTNQMRNDADIAYFAANGAYQQAGPSYAATITSPYDASTFMFDRNHPNLNGHAALVRFYGLLF